MRTTLVTIAFAWTAIVACSDTLSVAVEPTHAAVTGRYLASGDAGDLIYLRVEDERLTGEVVDWIALGARVVLELHPDGTTTGELFIPITDPELAPFFTTAEIAAGRRAIDLTGSWTLEDGTVRVTGNGTSVIHRTILTWSDGVLSGVFDPTRVVGADERSGWVEAVVLVRQETS